MAVELIHQNTRKNPQASGAEAQSFRVTGGKAEAPFGRMAFLANRGNRPQKRRQAAALQTEGRQGFLVRRPAIPLEQLLAGKLMALFAIDQVEQHNQSEIDAENAKGENSKWRHGESSFFQAFR